MMLHGVYDRVAAAKAKPPASSISIDVLKTNLLLLKRHYTIIPLDEAVEMMCGGRRWRGRCAVLTFDDSLKCFATVAAPLLAELGLPATFFLSTETFKAQKPYWWMRLEYAIGRATHPAAEVELPTGNICRIDCMRPHDCLPQLKAELKSTAPSELESIIRAIEAELGASLLHVPLPDTFAEILTWTDVRRLCELGMTVGSHTVTHPNLTLLSPERLRFELAESRHTLEAICQAPVRHLCYPYGHFSDEVSQAARDCGYISGMTTREPGWNPRGLDPLQLRRFSMPGERYKIFYVLSGAPEFLKSYKAGRLAAGRQ